MPLDANVIEGLRRNVFTPMDYHGSADPEYHRPHREFPEEAAVVMIQKRAEQDGQWAIDNAIVGPNENKMRVMMEFVKDQKMIRQALGHRHNLEQSLDFVCRDLALAAKVMANS